MKNSRSTSSYRATEWRDMSFVDLLFFEKSWECAWGFSEKCQNLDIRHFWNFFAGQNGLRGYFSNFVKNWIGNWKNWTNCRFWKFFTKFCDFFCEKFCAKFPKFAICQIFPMSNPIFSIWKMVWYGPSQNVWNMIWYLTLMGSLRPRRGLSG